MLSLISHLEEFSLFLHVNKNQKTFQRKINPKHPIDSKPGNISDWNTQSSKVGIFLVACQWKDYAFKYRWESEELKEMKRISKQTNKEDGMVKK